MQTFSPFSKSHIDHVNNGTLKIHCNIGVSSFFSCGDVVFLFNFCSVVVFRAPNAPLLLIGMKNARGVTEKAMRMVIGGNKNNNSDIG